MMARRFTMLLTAAALLSGTVYAAWSQEKSKASPAAGASGRTEPSSKKPKLMEVRYATVDYDAATDTTDLTTAVMTDLEEGTVIHADTMKVRNKKGVENADAAGNLLVTDKKADVTGDKATIFFAKSKRMVVLTGNVIIKVKPKDEQKDPTQEVGPMPVILQDSKASVKERKSDDDQSAASARKHPATITCDKVEYEYSKSKKHAVLTGNFKVVQKLTDHTRTLWADHAEWFGLEDRVLLHAPVRWEDTKDNGKGESPGDVTVFTKEDDEKIHVPKGGKYVFEVHEEDEDSNSSGGKAESGGSAGEKPAPGKPPEPVSPPKQPGPDKKALH